jgi:hypothetical protein
VRQGQPKPVVSIPLVQSWDSTGLMGRVERRTDRRSCSSARLGVHRSDI